MRAGGLALRVQSAKANPATVVQVSGESGVPLVPPPGGVAMPKVPTWAYALVFGGLFVLAILTWLSRRAKQGESSGAQRRVASTIEAKHGGDARQREAQAEAAALARDLTAELDARADRLERLIAEADVRLEQLAQASMHASTRVNSAASGGAAAKHATPTTPARPSFAASTHASEERLEDTTRAILSLADEGLTPVQIAQRLGQHVGKVELILALRQDRTS